MLDVASMELNPLGYNHILFKNAIAGQEFDQATINGCAADHVASSEFASLVKGAFGPIAPKGLEGITLVNS